MEQGGVESGLEHRPAAVDEQGLEPEEIGSGSAVAIVVVAVVCGLLAALPAAVPLPAPPLPVGWVAPGLWAFARIHFPPKFAARPTGRSAPPRAPPPPPH